MEHFEELMVQKIESGIELNKIEMYDLLEYETESERSSGENRRWSRGVSSIIKLTDRFFCLEWDEGLTEMQENVFYEQPYKVELHQYEKVIIVKEWKKV